MTPPVEISPDFGHDHELHAVTPTDDDLAEHDAAFERENDAAAYFAKEVASEVMRQRVREEARRRLAAEERATASRPRPIRLDDFLARTFDSATYRISELWPTGGRVMLAAQWKAGKTTLVSNAIRALVDNATFLGRFDTTPGARVCLIDNELDPRFLHQWLSDQGITNTRDVSVITLRGRVATFDILDPDTRTEWARELAGHDVIILDCLRPVLDALNLSEDKDGGRFLVAFDALLAEAGANEALVVHHMGHHGERSRGDSRLQDWPDALWKLVRDKDADDDQLDDPTGSRYFSAFGRDVNVTQAELTYQPDTRHLTLGEAALTRREASARRRSEQLDQAVIDAVGEHPGINKTKLRYDVRNRGIGRNEDIDRAVERTVERGLITRRKVGNTWQHYPGEEPLPAQPAQPAPDPPGHAGKYMPARPIGAGMNMHTPNPTDGDHQ
ncbi:AAA family ATPase [Nocardioides rotundus]|uniref:AAA family ATPase n=1 Tax=Nocardioides rotundus TaxID=1774216 RepID=UPI001CBD017F|nr:AAA family ATPase [Nocardioides rotundus]UAL31537.1 AAA family ATPase [Nocardioides rotundus]